MTEVRRVLPDRAIADLAAHRAGGGGASLDVLEEVGGDVVIDAIEAAGLRGRGGAGFPTGIKWRTVAANHSTTIPSTVVVNGAEGEPGSFKDREVLYRNPYAVLEGAAVAARSVHADRVVIAVKASFTPQIERLERAAAECRDAGWFDGIETEILRGPDAYLYGEETALLEVLEGRQPFPRTVPPYRQGADSIGSDTASAAGTTMAGGDGTELAPPALVNNVETVAHVPGIVANGPEWFRELGTQASPGTIVCTVSGDTVRAGVVEVPMGTPVREIIELGGGGMPEGASVLGVLSGVSHPLLPARLLDTPATHEDLDGVGAGLGAAGFIVFDDRRDPIAIAQAVSRFLAVESCGQCEPCKHDGLELSALLDDLRRGEAPADGRERIGRLLGTVTDEARCFLAHQQLRVGASIFSHFEARALELLERRGDAGQPVVISPLVDIDDGTAALDEAWRSKQPDWSFDETDSGQAPADRVDQRRDRT